MLRAGKSRYSGFDCALYLRTVSFLLAAFFLIASICAMPLNAQSAPAATVSFTLDFPNSDPEHYSIAVDSAGHAKYESTARISQESEDRETYHTDFDFSTNGRTRVFDLAAQANYFSGKLDSGKRNLAFTGAKKLAYQDGQRNNSADYNYSPIAPVQELTSFFQSVSATLEYGRKLAYSHRYQKLALDEELKNMEGQAKSNGLAELQAVRPVLQEIYDDATVINIVRARAQRLIEMSKAETTTSAH
jgi:hypothetical protein